MNLKEVKSYTEGLIKNYFKPKVLKKFDEDTNGNLTYGGNPISAKVSGKSNNAIEVMSDTTTPSNDGLYVKDLSEEVNKINIAQKTVNEDLDCIELRLLTNQVPVLNDTLKFIKEAGNLDFNNDKVTLKKNRTYKITLMIGYTETTPAMTDYPNNQFVVRDITNSKDLFYEQLSPASQKGYRFPFSNSKIITPTTDIDIDVYVKTVYIAGALSATYTKLFVEEVKRVITVDPMNYIDTNQGIEDIPVGNIITKIGNKTPAHYLQCDGSEYNIIDYPYLAQAIKDEFGTFNYYGGDGINTFKVPNLKSNPVSLIEPATSYTMPNYTISASSENTQLSHTKSWMSFNKLAGNAWNNTIQLPQWIQIEFNAPKTVSRYSMMVRNMDVNDIPIFPKEWILQGSNDGITFVDIDSRKNITPTSKGEVIAFDIPTVTYKIFRVNVIANNGYNGAGCYVTGIADIDLFTFENNNFIKYEPTYFIGSINGKEEITDLTNGFIDLTDSNPQNITLNESIENFDKIEITGEVTYKSSGTRLGLTTWYYNVSDLKERYNNSDSWQNGNQLNYGNIIVDGNISYILSLFKTENQLFLYCKFAELSSVITKMHVRIRGIKSIYAPDKVIGSGTN